MQLRIINWAHTVIVAVIAVLAFLGLIFLLAKIDSTLWSGQASGWAQAVGSVGAIAAAFLVASGQYHRDRAVENDRRQTDERRILKAVKAVFDRVNVLTSQIIASRDKSAFHMTTAVHIDALRQILKLLDQMPTYDIPHEELIIQRHNIQHLIAKTCDAFDAEYAALEGGKFDDFPPVARRASSLLKSLNFMLGRASSLCASELKQRPVRD